MLIYLTNEEIQHFEDIAKIYTPEWERIISLLDATTTTSREERNTLLIQKQAIHDSYEELRDAYMQQCQQIRFDEIKREGVHAIILHAKEQAPQLLERMHQKTVEDFPGIGAEDLEKIGKGTVKKGTLYLFADYATKWLKEELQLHIEAVRDDKDSLQALLAAIIEAVEDSPYTVADPVRKGTASIQEQEALAFKPEPLSLTPDSVIFRPNMPMYHGKATDALATLSNKDITENTAADKAVIQTPSGDVQVVIHEFSKVKGNLSINTHKLLCTSISEFTSINNYGGGEIITRVTIPFYEYARKLGYKIDERETDSPEAAAKEKKRAQEAVKTAKKRIRQDLELLQAMRWTWQEKVRGKSADFDSILLFERVAIRKGYIIVEFGRNMAEYLKRLPTLTQYPQGLLSIDARSENAYLLGLKMAEHFNMDNNQVKGTATRLKVKSLLQATKIPTFEMLQQEQPDDSRHWDRRIKEPFETALDVLTGKVISNWEYVKTKGEPLTDAEAYSISDYEIFSSLYVQFELLDPPDHEERLARRAKEKKAAAARKAAKEKRGRKKK